MCHLGCWACSPFRNWDPGRRFEEIWTSCWRTEGFAPHKDFQNAAWLLVSTPEDTPSLHVRTNPPKKNENKKLEAAACTPKHIICSFRRRCHGTALVLHVSWLDPTQQWKALFGFFLFFFFFFLTDLCILYEFLLFACFILPNRTSVHTQLATRWQAIQLCSKFDGVYIVTNAEKYKVRNIA